MGNRPRKERHAGFVLFVALGWLTLTGSLAAPSVGTAPESFLWGVAHLGTWLGNVLLPIAIGLFVVAGIFTLPRHLGQAIQLWMGAFLCALTAGIFRLFDTVFVGSAYSSPNAYAFALIRLIDYLGNVALPILGGIQVVVMIAKASPHSYYMGNHRGFGINIATALACFLAPGITRLIERFVQVAG